MKENYKVYMHIVPKDITGYKYDKYYIGITKLPVEKRWNNGRGYQRDHNGHMCVFGRAIEKYGWDNIRHEVLYTGIDEDTAKQIEIDLIDRYKSNCTKYKNPSYGYNMTDGGDTATVIGRGDSVDVYNLDGTFKNTYKTILDASKALGVSRQVITRLANGVYGRATKSPYIFKYTGEKLSDDDIVFYNKNIINAYDANGNIIGTYRCSEDVKASIGIDRSSLAKCLKDDSATYKGMFFRYNSRIANDKNYIDVDSIKKKYRVPIYKYDLSGKFVAEFSSISDAARECGCSTSNIWHVMSGHQHHCKGFYYRYADGDIDAIEEIHTQYRPVIQYDDDMNEIQRFGRIAEANAYFGKKNTHPSISAVCKGKAKHAFGYIWRYAS